MSEENLKEPNKKRWYVIQVYSGKEMVVRDALLEQIQVKGLESHFGEIIVPTEEVVEMRAGQRRRSKRKFFPGYVFLQVEMDEPSWHLVRSTTWVLGFTGGSAVRPAPISDAEANRILQKLHDGESKPKPKVLFEPGEVVRVVDGPFSDFDGVVEDVNYEKSRLRVSVSIFGRSTPVELEFGQIEKN